MGEAKRKKEAMTPVDRKALEMTYELANEGKLIMGGLAAYLIINKIDAETSPEFQRICDVWFSSAEHMWSSMFATLEPGQEETQAEIDRLDLVYKEISNWRDMQLAAYAKAYMTKGNA